MRVTVDFSTKQWKPGARSMISSKFSSKISNCWFWLDSLRHLELPGGGSAPSVSHPLLGSSRLT